MGNAKDFLEGIGNILEQKYKIKVKKNLPSSFLTLEALVLKVRHTMGNIIEIDTSCEFKYMLAAMDQVSIALREKMNWLKRSEFFLVVNNAGVWQE